MNNPDSNRRRIYMVRMDFQKDFIIRMCILIVAATVIASAIIYVFCGATVTTVFKDSRLSILSTNHFIMPYLLLSSLIATFCAGFACWRMTLIVSNRLAGPIYRLEKDIAKVAQGDLSVRFRLRQKDELQSLAKILNDMTKDWHKDISILKDQMVHLEKATPQSKASLEAVKSVLEKYKV